MTYEIRKISDVGVGHPVVARLGPQTSELANWLNLDQAKKLQISHLYAVVLTQRLLECHKTRDLLVQRMLESVEKASKQHGNQVREVPHIIGLQKIVEGFLYDAKNYLRDLLALFQILYDCDLKEASAFADLKEKGESKLSEWASSKFGDAHPLTKLIRSEECWSSELIRKRNAIEHPDEKSGSLNVENIRLSPEPDRYVPPTWVRTGGPDGDILKDMEVYLDNMLTLAEDLLAAAVLEALIPMGLVIQEIPVELRDKNCPMRLRVVNSPELSAQTRRTDPAKLIKGRTDDWEVVIGTEIHAQVTSRSKLFSGASTEFGGEPNNHVSLVDAAMPGMLPVINEECVRQAVRTGLGLNAKINLRSVFDRKNYFYPDLPQGYQISQYKSPIVGEGEVLIDSINATTVRVGIERIHLEQDAGKLLHDQRPDMSLVDLNRSGVALMEIVSKPDLRSADDAMNFVAKIRQILRYLGTCDGDMEKGSLRADVNVSVRKPGEALGTRCEIKNLNSINFIGQAIYCEARRQIEILEDGGAINQETRLFDPDRGETRSMRSKEEAHDYRYFPDPDLLPVEFSEAYVADLRASLPELPDQKKARFISKYGLSAYQAEVLVAERERADYFEKALAAAISSQLSPIPVPTSVTLPSANYDTGLFGSVSPEKLLSIATSTASLTINDVMGRANTAGITLSSSRVTPAKLGSTVALIDDGTISGKIAKDLLDIIWAEGGDPRLIVQQRGMKQVTDRGDIEKVVDNIIAANPDKVAQVKAKPAAVQWFVGQVMKSSGGKANPQVVNELLKSKLGL
jgi:aspartyl-tRNA(Asn)/glutamyl-tRNA(Gln) amidotransferase subunit B